MKPASVLLVFSGFAAVALPGAVRQSEWISRLPLRFEESRTDYVAHGPNFHLRLAPGENWLEWRDPSRHRTARLRTRLSGANRRAGMEPLDRLAGSANYFLGAAKNWSTDVAGFGRIRYHGVYPGIDLIFHGEGGRLEYDFFLAPKADPRVIRLELNGHRALRVDADGDLVVLTGAGEIRWKRPVVYQDVDGRRSHVHGRFVIADRGSVGFEIGAYDRSRALVIDPTLSYSTYLGGSRNEGARGIALDAAGNVYIAGNTDSTNLPSVSAFQANFAGETANIMGGDAFVAKFSPSGSLLYLTYLGGKADEGASALAVDAAGNAYITGFTTSIDFPVVNAFQKNFAGFGGNDNLRTGDVFVAKLSPTGNRLLYSTYLGGSMDDSGTAIVVDSAGNAYVAGATKSLDFPVSQTAYQKTFAGLGGEPIQPVPGSPAPPWDPGDAFIAKLDPTGGQLIFSTYLGGTNDDIALAIGLDSASNVYVGGCTISNNFPVTAMAYQKTWGGKDPQNVDLSFGDGFVAKLNGAGSSLIYSTYFGGPGDDCVSAIAVDPSGNVYMTGSTSSTNLKTSQGAFQPAYGGYQTRPTNLAQLYGDAFVGKLDATGAQTLYLTYLGGSANDGGLAIAVDGAGRAYVTGFTDSQDFPLAGGPLQSKMAGDRGQSDISILLYGDAFLAVVNPAGTGLVYSSYFGGEFDDIGFGVAADSDGNAYLVGNAISRNLTTTPNALQKTLQGAVQEGAWVIGDAFYAVFSGFPLSPPVVSKLVNAFGESPVIAANTWVAIKGTGLSGPDSRIWQTSDFVNDQMPTSLDTVRVAMNGKSAFMYFISPTQLNVLAPPDLGTGAVQVQVSARGITSSGFTLQAQQYSTSFFVFNGGPYVVATHLNGSDIGPPSLFPGLTTPARPGETVIIYANGFGPTTQPIVSGSIVQSGSLPSLPVIQIGGVPANVGFAGLISPGLYQFNVDIPAAAPDGDNTITATYGGSTTQAGTLITIQH